MRQFQNEGWDQVRHDTVFTAEAVRAEEAHADKATALDRLVAEWGGIDQSLRDAQDGVTRADARVRVLDGRLDRAVGLVAKRLAADAPALSARYFPERPSEVTKLALESELSRVAKWKQVAVEFPPPPNVAEALAQVAALDGPGQQALQARGQAETQLEAVRLKASAWREKVNGARRDVELALAQYAQESGLPKEYAADFFPAAERRSKKAEDANTVKPEPTPTK
jgi:hypothetical protein